MGTQTATNYIQKLGIGIAALAILMLTACGGGGGGGSPAAPVPPAAATKVPRFAYVANTRNDTLSTYVEPLFERPRPGHKTDAAPGAGAGMDSNIQGHYSRGQTRYSRGHIQGIFKGSDSLISLPMHDILQAY